MSDPGVPEEDLAAIVSGLGDEAIKRLRAMLADGTADMPGSALVQIVLAFLRYQERQDAVKEEAKESGQDIIDVVLEAGIPIERKLALLQEEHERTSARLARIEDVKRELVAREKSEKGR